MKIKVVPRLALHQPHWYQDKTRRHKVFTVVLALAAVAAVIVPAEIAHLCYTTESLVSILLLWEPEVI